ncbi:MAG: hypothetical protein SGARI_003402 [Bacillariaceae sp.]
MVAGESAGGGLAAELCQRLLDESKNDFSGTGTAGSLPLPVAQLLFYPMLDDRTCLDEEKNSGPTHFLWNSISNQYAWSSYLGPGYNPGDASVPMYAAAARREDLSSLPPAWIMVGELDLFLEECQVYADRLKNAGVETELLELKGVFHGFFTVGTEETIVTAVWDSFTKFAKRHIKSHKERR